MPIHRCRVAGCALAFLLTTAPGSLVLAQAPTGGVDSEDLLDQEPPAAAAETAVAEPDLQVEAAQAYADGDISRTIAIYRELGATHPIAAERSRFRVTAAWLLFEQGDRSGAGLELRQILFDSPELTLSTHLYSGDFIALYQDAQLEAGEARRRAAGQKLSSGIQAFKSGDLVGARRALDESLALQPQQPRALYSIAAIDLAEGLTDDALAGFEKVLALERGASQPLSPELKAQSLNNVGVIYIGRQQFEDAVEALDKAVRLVPRDARSWFNLGLARLALGRKIDGLDALRRAHELDRRDAEIALRLARVYQDAASWVEAVALLLDATRTHPDDAALWFELGRSQRGLGNAEGATTGLRRAVELDGDGARGVAGPAALMLAESALARRDFAAAAADAQTAARLQPEEATAWALLGLAQQGTGELAAAAASLEKAAALAPSRADIAHNLGTVYLGQRRLPEAEAAFRAALAADPAAAESAGALARLQAAKAGSTKGSPATSKPAAPPRAATVKPRPFGAKLSPVDYQPLGIRGLLVSEVTPRSLAARAGLLVDDLILRGDGQPLTHVPTLQALLRNPEARSLQLSVLRAGKPVELVLKFD